MKILVTVEGMMCPKCEAHVNEAFQEALGVKEVSSDAKKKLSTIVAEEDIPDEKIVNALEGSGYKVTAISREEKPAKKPFWKRG